MASMEQKKVDEKIFNFIENQKREKEAALGKILQLEGKLRAKQKLEMEIEDLMKQLEGESCSKLHEQMKRTEDVLNDEMEDLEALTNILLVRERKCNEELQEARKCLIEVLKDMSSSQSTIVIKRMGELAFNPFVKACKERFPAEEATAKSVELCSLWQEKLRKPEWHPFKTVFEEDDVREIINEEDEMLVAARNELGDEVCEAIITAIKEMYEYNPSGGFIVPELWNSREDRKATLKEAIGYLLDCLKTKKRKIRSSMSAFAC